MSNQLTIRTQPHKDINILKVMKDQQGVIEISADIRSESRDGLYHHTMLILNGSWLRFSCSCEASSYGMLCKHVLKLYNYYQRHRRELLREEENQGITFDGWGEPDE
ncbi:hypothetical protein [Sulfolobus acidocaldarius]|nr:hypothetical protein [Sulfolobus acidocaldarius]AGE70446.1 conjugative plasmid protein [Sulfolobus acidocaldarius N8]AGE72720.1 conjugative plasmid protein [Sulfolobus acidocaldarius Ron12/I]ALU29171.1 conjugal transfer protein [Sulfolobus acidocaldarius]ALU31896.1 conjugal transfer protein [Sulfolobus acidocaldarius]WCM34441.1 conjugal transfer protein [Sulfolobus acidocaldarius DSM 639]